MQVRIDKWLQVARVFKSRSRATRACQLGRVRVNGSTAKPHRPLSRLMRGAPAKRERGAGRPTKRERRRIERWRRD